MATAHFLNSQRPGGSAYAIGETGLTTALHDVGYVLTDRDPDYVVLGETTDYSYERISRAVRLVAAGARFIATNPDKRLRTEHGINPGTGAIVAARSTTSQDRSSSQGLRFKSKISEIA